MNDDVLAAYLGRIGLHAPLPPTVETLHRLARAHVCTLAFENIDVLLERRFEVDLDAVIAKLVVGGRGGYCFEHNVLMLAVLQALGFDARPLSARVRLGRERHEVPPCTHVFVETTVRGQRWYVDVGVGGFSCTAALRHEPGLRQATPHEARRIVPWQDGWLHQVDVDGRWLDVCEFTGASMPAIDREVAHWWVATHPRSHFRGRLLVARARADGGRDTLLDDRLRRRSPNGVVEEKVLTGPEEVSEALARVFDLQGVAPDARLWFPSSTAP